MAKSEQSDINELSFEEALSRLTKLVEKLETDQLQLEESVGAFEEGVKLSRRCESLLNSAEKRLQVLNDQENS